MSTEKPTCKTCPYWKPEDVDDEETVLEGVCRRHAPRATISVVREEDATWVSLEEPSRFADEWCGEHPDFKAYIKDRRREMSASLSPAERRLLRPNKTEAS